MSRRDKALVRLQSKPKDFTWSELKAVMGGFGYAEIEGSGSRRKFIHSATKAIISLHEPHPNSVLKEYQIRDVLTHLKEQGLA